LTAITSSEQLDFVFGLNALIATGEGGLHREITQESSSEFDVEIDEWISRVIYLLAEECALRLSVEANKMVKALDVPDPSEKACFRFFATLVHISV
jgi:hypothetical protein